jgi:peptide-methionine (S)-S-oxide reductase
MHGFWVNFAHFVREFEKQVSNSRVIKIIFDPSKISYELLLEIFFSVHDPTTPGRQGNDIGPQYRSIILYNSDSQKRIACEVISRLEKSGRFKNPIVTELKELDKFYIAEDYHQQYFFNNPYQPYCTAVVAPKVEKFIKNYKEKIKVIK